MEISKNRINVAIALFINFLIIMVYSLFTIEVTAKSSVILLIGLNNTFIFVLYLLTLPLESDNIVLTKGKICKVLAKRQKNLRR